MRSVDWRDANQYAAFIFYEMLRISLFDFPAGGFEKLFILLLDSNFFQREKGHLGVGGDAYRLSRASVLVLEVL